MYHGDFLIIIIDIIHIFIWSQNHPILPFPPSLNPLQRGQCFEFTEGAHLSELRVAFRNFQMRKHILACYRLRSD